MKKADQKSLPDNDIRFSDNKKAFPTCTELLTHGFELAWAYCQKPKPEFNNFMISVLHLIRQIEHYVDSYNNDTISGLVKSASILPDGLNVNEINDLIHQFKNRWKSENQFFTIFGISAGREVYIDPRINDILGLSGEDFKTASIDVLDMEQSIYERDELYAAMRHALIGYLVFSIPLFRLDPDKDYYTSKFRIRTHRSRLKHLQERKSVYAEKKCFFNYEYDADGKMVSHYHFDLYTILAEPEHDCFYNNIVSTPVQSVYLNMISYLINLYLLDISPKYLLMLDEKQHTDRYKVVADQIGKNIYRHTGSTAKITEHQIADYFSKSIRKRIAQIYNKWDQRKNGTLIDVAGDMDAIKRARQLGLLPIPPKVRDMIYVLVR